MRKQIAVILTSFTTKHQGTTKNVNAGNITQLNVIISLRGPEVKIPKSNVLKIQHENEKLPNHDKITTSTFIKRVLSLDVYAMT